jgi:hypothetical protein
VALDLLLQLRQSSLGFVGGVQDPGQCLPRVRRQDAAHPGHQAEHLLPFFRIALHARRPASLLVTEGALAHEFLAHVLARHAL